MEIYIVICVLLLLFSLFDFYDGKQRIVLLYLLAFLMVLFIGLRGECGTDSLNYITYFKDSTDSLWNWKGVEKEYAEYGFYFLSVLIKSVFDNVHFYFIVISLLTISLLVSSLKRLCLLPIFGFCIYFMRFLLARDMNQIRQALAIMVVIYALRFIINGNIRKFFLVILLATTIHYSIIIVFPFVLLYKLRLSFKKACSLLIFSGIIGWLLGISVKALLLSTNLSLILNYVGDEDLGLHNPVIYYQVSLCLFFFYFEKKLSAIQEGYFIIRNAYLYSTIILLLTCNLGVIGGRLATIFATCEIFIIPSLIYVVHPKRYAYAGLIVLMSIFFFLNYVKLMEVGTWEYSFNF